MSWELQKDNVVRIVDTEHKKNILLAQGFTERAKKVEVELDEIKVAVGAAEDFKAEQEEVAKEKPKTPAAKPAKNKDE